MDTGDLRFFLDKIINPLSGPFWALFAEIWPNEKFPEKSDSVSFDDYWPVALRKTYKNLLTSVWKMKMEKEQGWNYKTQLICYNIFLQ